MKVAPFLERASRILAIAVAVHGVVFAVCSVTIANLDKAGFELVGEIYFFAIVAPALLLAVPLEPLLWRLHLMHTPGWFAWPKGEGFVLVYVAWVLAFLAVSFLARALKR